MAETASINAFLTIAIIILSFIFIRKRISKRMIEVVLIVHTGLAVYPSEIGVDVQCATATSFSIAAFTTYNRFFLDVTSCSNRR